jgi:CMP-N,N'-diacetyllegionaminic acid synthase
VSYAQERPTPRGGIALRTVALIPARGGSKGLPRKNLLTIGGSSLVRRAVETALAVASIDEVVVSSDDDDILAEASASGAAVERRPDELATDQAGTLEVVRDLLEKRAGLGVLVLLQPTSPLREPQDVEATLAELEHAHSAATVTAVEHPPEWCFHLGGAGELKPPNGWDGMPIRRQDAPDMYRLNGAVYASLAGRLRRGSPLVGPGTHGVVMPPERSVDIDDEHDLAYARFLVERGGLAGPDEVPEVYEAREKDSAAHEKPTRDGEDEGRRGMAG